MAVGLLAVLDGVSVVAAGEVGIDGRVPHRVVNAVEDAVQLVRALFQQPFQPTAEGRCADFPRVGRADGGDGVGAVEPAFHAGEPAPELQCVGRPPVRGQSQGVEGVAPELALVGQVVDGEHQPRPLRRAGEPGGGECGLPVVQVHHLRRKVRRALLHELRERGRKAAKAEGAIGEGLLVLVGVGRAGAIEQRRCVEQIHRQAIGQRPATHGEVDAVDLEAGHRFRRTQLG